MIGQNVIKLNEVDSTNSYALKLVKKFFPEEGTVIYAAHQISGRGRRGKVWESEKDKNLTISLILYPRFLPLIKQFALTQAISLGISKYLEKTLHFPAKIKWPNDIYVDGGKIAGILIENAIMSDKITFSIIGIGLNVNQSTFTGINATSMNLITGIEFDLVLCLKELCEEFDKYYGYLSNGKFDLLNDEYRSALYRLDETANYLLNGELVNGIIRGCTAEGKLIIEQDGRKVACAMDEVEFR